MRGPWRAALAVFGVAAAACASPQPPPGGEPDEAPPRLVGVTPEPYVVLDGFDDDAVFRFDERISEQLDGVRELREAVLVSPETGAVGVDRGGNEIRVSIDGGWQAGHVYRIEVRPVFRDLFGNRAQDPLELVFSTGPPIPETALAGIATDRITGDPAADVRVEALRRADSVTYVALTDTAGFFAMRFIPAGAYDLLAYRDRNGDRVPDFGEARDTATAVLAVDDTVVVSFAVLPGDSTAARLVRVTEASPTHVRMAFDDHFDPTVPVEGTVRLFALPDSVPAGGGRLVHGAVFGPREGAAARATDEAEADTAAADTLPEPADTAAVERLPQPGDRAAPGALPDLGEPADTAEALPALPEAPLPSREIVLVPEDTLTPGAGYVVEVDGIINIAGVPAGGGAVRFSVPEAEPPAEPADTAAVDTIGADTIPRDTVPPDTMPPDTVPPDTVPPDTVPPDTVPPDTVPPDTVPPDSAGAASAADAPPPDTGAIRRLRSGGRR